MATTRTSLKFGKFETLSGFLESYKLAEKKETFKDLTLERISNLQNRNVVEVEANLVEREPDDLDAAGGQHYRLRIQVTSVLQDDTDVSADLSDAVDSGREVFVAIRFGDSMGIQDEIDGLEEGATLKLKGEWITRDRAHAHGGERMSVLHFTHHPLGYICTPSGCYA